VVVGFARKGCQSAHAFKWQESTGMVDLGSSVAGRSSEAHAVSDDGSVVVGEQIAQDSLAIGVRWVGGRQEMIPGEAGRVGIAFGVNSDGTIAVGRQCRPESRINDQSAWMWTADAGTKCLPVPAFRQPQQIEIAAGGAVRF
jgi:probable HAF family extracellular repeat protein